jgi:hypothetical protein
MAYPITRQFGPNAKGSELSFTDMDFNLLYFESKVTGSSNYIAMYSGSTYLTSSVMYQLNGGIGIGTTNPYSIFNVIGTTTIGYPGVSSNSHIQFWPTNAGGNAYYIVDSGSILKIGTGEYISSGTDVISIASTNVGVGTTSPQAKFVISNNGAQGMEFGYSAALTSSYVESYNRSSSAAADMTYYIGPGTGSHRFYTGGAERMRIDKDGYVGINKNNPTAPLDILGTAIVTGSTTLTGSLLVTGTTTLTGSLLVTGTNTITGSTEITGSLNIRGPITISSTDVITGSAFISGSIGYFGVGSTVTQTGARTSGVTINNLCGTILMASAAGSATASSFVVTNNKISIADIVILSIRATGVTNLYDMFVTDVQSGSFRIVFRTTGGVATDTPYINFAIFKGTTS